MVNDAFDKRNSINKEEMNEYAQNKIKESELSKILYIHNTRTGNELYYHYCCEYMLKQIGIIPFRILDNTLNWCINYFYFDIDGLEVIHRYLIETDEEYSKKHIE